MADYNPVDPQNGWEYDLHSVYAAYIGHFQSHNVTWWTQSWGTFFATFDQFLQFGWPAIVVTDVYEPYDAHIVTTYKNIQAFIKMIRTRFGESLEAVPNITKVQPFETRQRPMRHINDIQFYKKIHATLPAAALAARKERIRSGDPYTISELWKAKEKNFLAIDFEWSEKNSSTCLEFGYAALRSKHVAASGAWPPIPDNNFRVGHYVVSEYVDTVVNRRFPTFPRAYGFGTTHFVPKRQLSIIIQAIVDSLCSPESETQSNDLVVVAHGIAGDLERLAELKIKLPSNTFILDTTAFERQLFRIGRRPPMLDPTTNFARQAGSTLSLANLMRSLGVDISPIVFHNSGNDAFAALLSFQLLLEPETRMKRLRKVSGLPPVPPQLLSASPSRPGIGTGSGPISRQPSDIGSIPVSQSSHLTVVDSQKGKEGAVFQSGYAVVVEGRSTQDEIPTYQSGFAMVDDSEEEEEEEEEDSEEGVQPVAQTSRAPGHGQVRGQGGGRGPGRRGAGRRGGFEDGMKNLKV